MRGISFSIVLILFVIIVFTGALPVIAEELPIANPVTEDVLDDFSEDAESDYSDVFPDDLGDDFVDDITIDGSSDAYSTESEKESPFSLDGHFSIASSYNIAHEEPPPGQTDWRGLSRLRSELYLELDTKLPGSWLFKVSGNAFYDAAYAINGRDDYTDAVLDENEYEVEFRKVFLRGSITDKLDLKTGRQIVVWGKSDNIRVTDVLNPIDLREPGLVDLEDLRLPTCMTKLDYYIGDWNISGIAMHERRFNKQPAFGSDFYPLDTPYPPKNEPSDSLSDTEYGVSVNGVFSGWDMSFYYADFYEKNPVVKFKDLAPVPTMELQYNRLSMVGTDINIALGNWLFKTEMAFFDGIKYSDYANTGTLPPIIQILNNEYSKTDILLGIEYTGINDTTFTIEGMNSHVNNIDQQAIDANVSEDSFQSAVRITRNFINERLECIFLALIYGKKAEDGSIYRLTAEYELSEAILLTGGAVFYGSGDLMAFQNIGSNDRVYFDFEYSF